MNIGQRIRGLRGRAGLTQTALAQRLATSQAYVAELENGGEKSEGVSVRQAKRIAAQLGVDVTALVSQPHYDQALAQPERAPA